MFVQLVYYIVFAFVLFLTGNKITNCEYKSTTINKWVIPFLERGVGLTWSKKTFSHTLVTTSEAKRPILVFGACFEC